MGEEATWYNFPVPAPSQIQNRPPMAVPVSRSPILGHRGRTYVLILWKTFSRMAGGMKIIFLKICVDICDKM